MSTVTESSRILEIQKLNKAIERRNNTIRKLRQQVLAWKENATDANTAHAMLEECHFALRKEYDELKEDFRHEVQQEVEERLQSLNAEAEAWDKEASNLLMQLCEEWGLDRTDYPDGVTIQDAYDYLFESKREYDELKFRMDGLEK